MRTLRFQMQLSIDGYCAGPNGEMDWIRWDVDQDFNDYVWSINNPVDTILMGRKMAGGFISAWEERLEDPESATFASKMLETPKLVFTKTMTENPWDNTKLISGDLAEEVTKLKKAPGGDIVAYGGAGFAASLIGTGLIDEYHLFINPRAIGKGLSIFPGRLNLKLINSKVFSNDIVLLYYKPER